jgi:hypothetical protein
MAYADPFALQNSAVNRFLFAEVGVELNGSALTVLSVLARLGADPWSEALAWAKLPKSAIVDRLAERIAQMPLCPQALMEARATASRLVLLLPSQSASSQDGRGQAGNVVVPTWVPMLVFSCALAVGMAINVLVVSTQGASVNPAAAHVPATTHGRYP